MIIQLKGGKKMKAKTKKKVIKKKKVLGEEMISIPVSRHNALMFEIQDMRNELYKNYLEKVPVVFKCECGRVYQIQ